MTFNILVVDDSKIARDSTILQLDALRTEFPLTIEVASDGLEAVIKVVDNSGYFDLVLMDVEMPRLNGYEATSRMKLVDPNLRIALLTSNASSEDFRAGRYAGCNHYFLKPLNPSDLRVALRLVHLYSLNKR